MNSAPLSLETLAVRVTSLEHTAERNSEDHGKIYARVEAVEKGQAVVNSNVSNIITVCNEIKQDVKELKEKPVKRYDSLVNSIIQWLAIAALGAITLIK